MLRSFFCVCVCGLLFREKHLSNFILHASIRHLLFSLTVRTVRAAVFNSDPDNGISEPRLCIMFTLKWADNAGFRSCRSKCVNSHVFNRLPRGDREEISDAYSARDESSDYPVCWSPLIQPHAHACAPGACASRTRVWKWLEKTVHFEGALIRLSMIKKKKTRGGRSCCVRAEQCEFSVSGQGLYANYLRGQKRGRRKWDKEQGRGFNLFLSLNVGYVWYQLCYCSI